MAANATTYHPPELLADRDRATLPAEHYYYVLQDTLVTIIMDLLYNEGKTAQGNLMLWLVGQKQKLKTSSDVPFYVAQETVMKYTGLSRTSYIKAREALVERGWISYKPYDYICIEYEHIYNEWNDTNPEWQFQL